MLFRFETENFTDGIGCTVEFSQEGNPFRINFWAETDMDLVQGLSYFTGTHRYFMKSVMDFYKAPESVIKEAIDKLERLVKHGWMETQYFMQNYEHAVEEVIEYRARMLEQGYDLDDKMGPDCSGFTARKILIPEQLKPFINREFFKYENDGDYDGDNDKVTVKEETKVEMEFETSDYCAYEPVKVWYNPPYTTVEFDDGEKVTTKCQDGDTFSKTAGFAICCLKKEFEGWTGAKNVIEKCEYRANRKKLIREAQKEARKAANEHAREVEANIRKQRHEALVRKFYEERKAKDEALQRFYEHEAKRNEMAPTAEDES